jgi:hypothetical protein
MRKMPSGAQAAEVWLMSWCRMIAQIETAVEPPIRKSPIRTKSYPVRVSGQFRPKSARTISGMTLPAAYRLNFNEPLHFFRRVYNRLR